MRRFVIVGASHRAYSMFIRGLAPMRGKTIDFVGIYDPNRTRCEVFRREVGESVMGYHAACRIALAKHRIAEGAPSFTAIAEELGFSSVGYFSKAFRAHTGMSPTAYSRALSKRRAEVE